MKTKLITSLMFSLLTLSLMAGNLDGYWRCDANNNQIEILYTRDGIKVRSANGHDWQTYNTYGLDSYRDRSGNCYSFKNGRLEYCSFDRRDIYNYSRYDNNDNRGWNDRNNNGRDRDWDYNRRGNDRDNRDRDNWNNYYRVYEGKWHNHTTGTHIHVDLSRRSLRIKFHGERWFEVVERSRGIFIDKRGNEFLFRGDGIEYRSNDNDLMMRFYHDDKCTHRDDYRSEYWR